MTHEPHLETAEAVPAFGRGTGCTIKQLEKEMAAAMDHMKLAHTHGQGSGWGRGQPRRRWLQPTARRPADA